MGRQGKEILVETAVMTADRVGHLFCDLTGTPIGAGLDAVGVLRASYKSGEVGDIDILGTAMVTVGAGGLVRGNSVAADAAGKAVVAVATDVVLGIALETASASALCEILLVKGGGVA